LSPLLEQLDGLFGAQLAPGCPGQVRLASRPALARALNLAASDSSRLQQLHAAVDAYQAELLAAGIDDRALRLRPRVEPVGLRLLSVLLVLLALPLQPLLRAAALLPRTARLRLKVHPIYDATIEYMVGFFTFWPVWMLGGLLLLKLSLPLAVLWWSGLIPLLFVGVEGGEALARMRLTRTFQHQRQTLDHPRLQRLSQQRQRLLEFVEQLVLDARDPVGSTATAEPTRTSPPI
jgi:hypothetical protein